VDDLPVPANQEVDLVCEVVLVPEDHLADTVRVGVGARPVVVPERRTARERGETAGARGEQPAATDGRHSFSLT
jgi:hypothetical protein